MQVMEIIAPRGSMRLESFPTLEKFYSSEVAKSLSCRMSFENWEKLDDAVKMDKYSKIRKRFVSQQGQGIKAFMKQQRYQGENRHH